MSNFLLVNWGTKDKQYTFKTLEKKKLNIFLATSKDHPSWVLDYIPKERLIYTNTYESDKLVVDVVNFMTEHQVKFDHIATFFEMNMLQTARLARYLNLSFLESEVVMRTSANKYLMRNFCRRNKIVQPNYALFRSEKEGLEVMSKLSKNYTRSVVIKPVVSGHSYGVLKISGKGKKRYEASFKQKLKFAHQQLNSNFDEWMKYNRFSQYFLIEEFVSGEMVSVDGLVVNNKIHFSSVTDFKISQPPLFLQIETYIPSHLSNDSKKSIKKEAEKIIKTLGVDTVGFHCEFKVFKGEVFLIEFAARLPGGQMLEAYKQAYDIDLADLYLDCLMGKKLPTNKYSIKKYVLQESIPLSHEGKVKSVKGLNIFSRDKNLLLFSSVPVGKLIKKYGEIFEPLLYYQAKATSKQELKQLQEMVKKKVKVEIVQSKIYRIYDLRDVLKKMMPAFLRKILFNKGYLKRIVNFFE
ncbi:MAG: ATP-grasp domain-containing protein [Patescibacteria group bacterium]|nr:ATP-grasp domain-containing protein [Patescibacteria group bacterium]